MAKNTLLPFMEKATPALLEMRLDKNTISKTINMISKTMNRTMQKEMTPNNKTKTLLKPKTLIKTLKKQILTNQMKKFTRMNQKKNYSQ